MQTFTKFSTFFFALTFISISILPFSYCFDESTVERVQEQNQLEKAIFHYFEKRSIDLKNDKHFQKRASSSENDKGLQSLQNDGKGSPSKQHDPTAGAQPYPSTDYINSKGDGVYVGKPLNFNPKEKSGRSRSLSNELRQRKISGWKPEHPSLSPSNSSPHSPSFALPNTILTLKQTEYHFRPNEAERYKETIKKNDPNATIKIITKNFQSPAGPKKDLNNSNSSSPKSIGSPKRNEIRKRSLNEYNLEYTNERFQKRASSSNKDKSFQNLQNDGKGSPPTQHVSISDSHPPPTTHYIDSKGYHMYVGPPLHQPKPEQKTGRSSYYSDELRQKTIASFKPVYPNHPSSTTSSSPPSPPPASTSLTIRHRREFHLLPSQMEKYHDLIKENEPYASIKVYKDTGSSSGGSSPKSNRSPKRNSSFKKRSVNEFDENTFKHFEKRASGSDKDKNFQNLQNDENPGSPLKQHDTIPGSSEQSNTNHYVNSHGYKYYVGSPISPTNSNERKDGNQHLSSFLHEKKMATLKPLHPTSSSPSTPHSTDQIVFGSKQREYHLEPNSVEKYKETIKRNDQNATIKSIEKPLPSSIGLKKDYKGSSNRSPPRSPEHK